MTTALLVEFPLTGPLSDLFPAVARERLPFILDSSRADERLGRWSFLGFDPAMAVTARGERTIVRTRTGRRCLTGSPFAALRGLLIDRRVARHPDAPPFAGGAVGFLAYDLKQHLERLPDTVVHDIPLPDLAFGFYPGVLAYEHATGRCLLCVSDWDHRSARGRSECAADWMRRWRTLVECRMSSVECRVPAGPLPSTFDTRHSTFDTFLRANFTRPAYLSVVRRALDYIAAGDIFQVNLSQRFAMPFRGDPFDLYARLRAANPAPFSAYLSYPFGAVLSSSPERFLKVTDGHVETRPIKGTRPRTGDEARDAPARADLLASPKDNAELTMIVDLERNDLGRVCRYGSVRVPELRLLETHPTVYHLVATVVGDLDPRRDLVDLLEATFPGGSITGAPKIRAMQIIDELEPTARSVYTGALGWIGLDGSCDLSIVIRTILVAGGTAYAQVGGGIVADSVPEAEYDETLDKGRALFDAMCAV